MRLTYGSPENAPLECINPHLTKWRMRWDYKTEEKQREGSEETHEETSYMEEEFLHEPSVEEMRNTVVSWVKENIGEYAYYLDEQNIWLDSSERSVIKTITQNKEGKIKLPTPDSFIELDAKYALQAVNEMDSYEKELSDYKNQLILNVKVCVSAEEIKEIDFYTGMPTPIHRTTEELKQNQSASEKDSPEKAAVKALKLRINTMGLSANDALECQPLYPIWGEYGAEMGKKVEEGFMVRVVEYGVDGEKTSDVLWEAIQSHTLQENWKPSLDTASLWKRVDKEHAGTKEDPIPFEKPMEVFNGKYYTEGGVTYLCTRDSGIPLAYDLSALVGQYVEVTE